jgi:hypothetical protein
MPITTRTHHVKTIVEDEEEPIQEQCLIIPHKAKYIQFSDQIVMNNSLDQS